jgi:hypothetical protein
MLEFLIYIIFVKFYSVFFNSRHSYGYPLFSSL